MSVGRANRTFERLDVEPLAVGVNHLFDRFDRDPGLENALIVTAVLRGQILGKQIEVGFAAKRFERITERFTEPLVAEDEAKSGVLPEDAQRQAFDQRLVMSIRFAQCFPRGDIFRHIPEQNLHTDDPSLLISDGRRDPVDDSSGAVQPRQLLVVM